MAERSGVIAIRQFGRNSQDPLVKRAFARSPKFLALKLLTENFRRLF